MNRWFILYTRRYCCLYEWMKAVIENVTNGELFKYDKIDVDSSPQLAAAFGTEITVLFIDDVRSLSTGCRRWSLKREGAESS